MFKIHWNDKITASERLKSKVKEEGPAAEGRGEDDDDDEKESFFFIIVQCLSKDKIGFQHWPNG